MCRLLNVSRSGYYVWRDRPESARSQRRQTLAGIIRQAHQDSRQLYGSPRVHAAIRAEGVQCCIHKVASIMRKEDLRARTKRKYKAKTHSALGKPSGAPYNRKKISFVRFAAKSFNSCFRARISPAVDPSHR